MATKKTQTNKSLKQLADALPKAYEMHSSGGTEVGKLKFKLKENPTPEQIDNFNKQIPEGCVAVGDIIWRPHVYKTQINHYKRLKKAYEDEGIAGVQKYLAGIRKAQEERKSKVEKDLETKQTEAPKVFSEEEIKGGDGLFANIDKAYKQSNNEIQTQETLPDADHKL